MFGLTEDPTDQTSDKVGRVFELLGLKPEVEAIRIGLKVKKQLPESQTRESLSLQFQDGDLDSYQSQ